MAKSGSFTTGNYQGRALKFSWNVASQNISNNTTTINWTLDATGKATSTWYMATNIKLVIDGKTVYSTSNWIKLYENTNVSRGTFTFNHGSDGSRSFKASAEAGIYYSTVNCKGNGSFELPVIPRSSVMGSVSGSKITDNFSVSYKKYVSSYTDKLEINVSGRAVSQSISNYTSGATFTLNDAIKKDIHDVSKDSEAATLAFKLITYSGSTKIGQSGTITRSVTINDSQPSIGSISYTDTNSKTVVATGDASKVVQNQSVVTVTVTDLKAFNGATLATLEITAGDNTTSVSLSGSYIASKTVSIGTVNTARNTLLKAVLTDSRGYTAVTSIAMMAYEYRLPTAIIKCVRKNNFYNQTSLFVNSLCSGLGGQNTVTITEKHRTVGTDTYSTAQTLTDGLETILDLDNSKAWNVHVEITDKLNTTVYDVFVDVGTPILFIDRLKNSVGVNCLPSRSGTLELNGFDLSQIFYKSGETVTLNTVDLAGMITSGGKELDFTIPLGKSAAMMKSVTITELKLNVRNSSGGYALASSYVSGGYNVLTDSAITIKTGLRTNSNMLYVQLNKTSAYNATNNTPLAVRIDSMKFTIN